MVYNFKIRFLFYNYSLIVKTLQNCCFFFTTIKRKQKIFIYKETVHGNICLKSYNYFIYSSCVQNMEIKIINQINIKNNL